MSVSDQGVEGDVQNIAVLLFLYILQGIPLGLAAAVPLILTNRNIRQVVTEYKKRGDIASAHIELWKCNFPVSNGYYDRQTYYHSTKQWPP